METLINTEKKIMALTQIERINSDFKKSYEQIGDEINTIPNQSLSVPDILEKFRNGTLGNIAKQVYYDEDLYDPTLEPDYDIIDAERDLRLLQRPNQEIDTQQENVANVQETASQDDPKENNDEVGDTKNKNLSKNN